VTIAIGKRRHLVTLQTSTAAEGAGGDYGLTWAAMTPSQVYAAVEPATAQRLERIGHGAVIAQATHLVTIPYVASVTTKARVLLNGRALNVVGVANVEERNIELILVCVEAEA
jgi:SPP1 family predicted phage head-tail adaptor